VFGALGMFMYGDLVETKSGDFISTYLGQTEPKTRSRMDLSLEKVLLIDEAYSIGANQTYGSEAITAIVDYTSINIGLLMVIVAGYEKDMKENFFDLNEGLQRRFENVFVFEAYSPEELSNIMKNGLRRVSQSNPELGTWGDDVFDRIKDLVTIGRKFDAWAKKGASSLELMFEEEGRQVLDAYDQLFSKQAGSIQTILSKARRYMGVPDKQRKTYNLEQLLQVLQACLAPNLRKKLQITTATDAERVKTSSIFKYFTNQLVFKFGGYTPTADEMVTLFERGVRNLPGDSTISVGPDVKKWLKTSITIGRLCSIDQVAEYTDGNDCPRELYGLCSDIKNASEFLGSGFFKVVYSTFLAKKTKSIELLVQMVGTYAQSTRVVALNVEMLNTILYEKLEAIGKQVDKLAFKKNDPSNFDEKLNNLWERRADKTANRLYSSIVALAVASALQDEGRELPVSMYAGIIWRTSSLVAFTTFEMEQTSYVDEIRKMLENIYDLKSMVRTYTSQQLGETDLFSVDAFSKAFKMRLVNQKLITKKEQFVEILDTDVLIDNVWSSSEATDSIRQPVSPEIVQRELGSLYLRRVTPTEFQQEYEEINSNYNSTLKYFETVLTECRSQSNTKDTFDNKAKEWIEEALTNGYTRGLMVKFLERIYSRDQSFYTAIQQTQLVDNVEEIFKYETGNATPEMAQTVSTFATQLMSQVPQPGFSVQFPLIFYELFFLHLILSAAIHYNVDLLTATRENKFPCNFLREAMQKVKAEEDDDDL
jgi:response regulator RpfG family c-di-GMP phosphodiesterase